MPTTTWEVPPRMVHKNINTDNGHLSISKNPPSYNAPFYPCPPPGYVEDEHPYDGLSDHWQGYVEDLLKTVNRQDLELAHLRRVLASIDSAYHHCVEWHEESPPGI